MVQIRDPQAEHTHADADEILYVVAGEGAVKVKGASTAISAGSLAVLPRGTAHAIDRSGRNPLIVISVLSDQPCPKTGGRAVQALGPTITTAFHGHPSRNVPCGPLAWHFAQPMQVDESMSMRPNGG